MQLILISGRAGVGNTTLANFIASRAFELGLIPKLLPFAGPLKQMAIDKGYDKEDHPEKYRKFCQEYGAMMRKDNPDHLVELFSKELKLQEEKELKCVEESNKFWEHCIIVDDCRYMNEIALGMKYKASLIFLTYGNRKVHNMEEEWRKHHSEDLANKVENGDKDYRELFTHILANGGTEEDLIEKAFPMVPIWCGINPPETGQCQCEGCRAKREGRMLSIDSCLKEIVDLLFMLDLDEEEQKGLFDDEET